MVTPITYPPHKKARHGLTPGKTYTCEMKAFVKVDHRTPYVQPAWRVVDDTGRMRWIPVSLFDPNDPDGAY